MSPELSLIITAGILLLLVLVPPVIDRLEARRAQLEAATVRAQAERVRRREALVIERLAAQREDRRRMRSPRADRAA